MRLPSINLLKEVLYLAFYDESWKNPGPWAWDARPGILTMGDGNNKTSIAVGFHLRPHLSEVGSARSGLPSISRDKGNDPLGGHMCMYYLDSWSSLSGDMKPEYNDAAKTAYIIARNIVVWNARSSRGMFDMAK